MPSPGKSRHCQVTIGDESVMVFGGSSKAVYRLDLKEDTWSTWPPTNYSHSGGVCGVIFGGESGQPESVVVAGGFSGNSVEILDLETRQWTLGKHMFYSCKISCAARSGVKN